MALFFIYNFTVYKAVSNLLSQLILEIILTVDGKKIIIVTGV